MKNLNPMELLKNVKKGPKTSLLGLTLMCFGGYMIYKTDAKVDLTYTSIEVVVFLLGTWLCAISDGFFVNNDEDDDGSK